jgi:hypothetical protein
MKQTRSQKAERLRKAADGVIEALQDWYHAKQHLVDGARLMKREGATVFRHWLNSRETLLHQGHAEKIANQLEKAATKDPAKTVELVMTAGYFKNNHRRMNYIELCEDGWPIGSGMV